MRLARKAPCQCATPSHHLLLRPEYIRKILLDQRLIASSNRVVIHLSTPSRPGTDKVGHVFPHPVAVECVILYRDPLRGLGEGPRFCGCTAAVRAGAALQARGRSPIAFTQSNPKGLFTLKVKEAGTYRLEVRSLGHAEHLQEVSLGNTPEVQLGSIQLRAHYEEIHAVQVEGERPVVRKGDSVVYQVGAFAKGNERSIGEVMNRMPGLYVSSDGSASYQGWSVSKMMVGGTDLFGQGYGVLTNNLNPSAVKEVQVLENFEESRLLKRARRKSERVAINLEMKDGAGQVVGTLDGSYGYRYMHRANVSLVGVKHG